MLGVTVYTLITHCELGNIFTKESLSQVDEDISFLCDDFTCCVVKMQTRVIYLFVFFMKCPLLMPSRRWRKFIVPISQCDAVLSVQLWPHYAPAPLSAVICAINLAECPFN